MRFSNEFQAIDTKWQKQDAAKERIKGNDPKRG